MPKLVRKTPNTPDSLQPFTLACEPLVTTLASTIPSIVTPGDIPAILATTESITGGYRGGTSELPPDFFSISPLERFIILRIRNRSGSVPEQAAKEIALHHARHGVLWSHELDALATLPYYFVNPMLKSYLDLGASYLKSLSNDAVLAAWNTFPSNTFRLALAQHASYIPPEIYDDLITNTLYDPFFDRTDIPHIFTLMAPSVIRNVPIVEHPRDYTENSTIAEQDFPTLSSREMCIVYRIIKVHGAPVTGLYGLSANMDQLLDVLDHTRPIPAALPSTLTLRVALLFHPALTTPTAATLLEELTTQVVNQPKPPGVTGYYSYRHPVLTTSSLLHLPLASAALTALAARIVANPTTHETTEAELVSLIKSPNADEETYRAAVNPPASWSDVRPLLASIPRARSDKYVRTALERCFITPILAELIKDPDPKSFDRLWPRLLKRDPNTALGLLEANAIPDTVKITSKTLASVLTSGTPEQKKRAIAVLSKTVNNMPPAQSPSSPTQ